MIQIWETFQLGQIGILDSRWSGIVLVLAQIDDVEIPVRQVVKGIEGAVGKDDNLDTLVCLQICLEATIESCYFDLAEIHFFHFLDLSLMFFQASFDFRQSAHYVICDYQDFNLNRDLKRFINLDF